MYECSANDRNEIESIQGQILERIQYLRERNLDIETDEILLDYYSFNDEVISCILNDQSFSPIIFGIIGIIGMLVVYRIWKLRKKNLKDFKGNM